MQDTPCHVCGVMQVIVKGNDRIIFLSLSSNCWLKYDDGGDDGNEKMSASICWRLSKKSTVLHESHSPFYSTARVQIATFSISMMVGATLRPLLLFFSFLTGFHFLSLSLFSSFHFYNGLFRHHSCSITSCTSS